MAAFDRAIADYEAAQAENADLPEALSALGDLAPSRSGVVRAEEAFRRALALAAFTADAGDAGAARPNNRGMHRACARTKFPRTPVVDASA